MLASVDSPPMARLDQAHQQALGQLLRGDAGQGPRALQARRPRHHGGAARALAAALRPPARARGARLVDGSGLARGDRASPFQRGPAARARCASATSYDAFFDSLPIAGRDGTLVDRMRRGPARNRCHGKTGTLSDVSALSGYCEARSGDIYAFSILMNGVYADERPRASRTAMVQAIAAP